MFFVGAFFQVTFCIAFFSGMIDRLELLKQGFRKKGIAKTMFTQKMFSGDSRVDCLLFFGGLGSSFF